MIRLVITNQRGGVAKTVTTATLARFFSDLGMRVLVVDTDPQASLGIVLGLRPQRHLHEFVVHNHSFEECVARAGPNIDVLCSNRETTPGRGGATFNDGR
jgi:chromosome partitioning protein